MADEFQSCVETLWQIPVPGPANLYSDPAFTKLAEAIRELRPDAGKPVFALGTALRNVGLPCGLSPANRHLSLSSEEAALRLRTCVSADRSIRRHLVPLDLADQLPELKFGNAKLGSFSADQLRLLFGADRLRLFHPSGELDADRLSQFHWLVVEELVEVGQPLEARAVPFMFDVTQDLGRIDPHRGRFPPAVEDALFFLLLAPWEDWALGSVLNKV